MKITKQVCALVLSCMVGAVQAGVVTLSPTSQSATTGNPVSFGVFVDFAGDPTIGGSFQLSYNSTLLGINNIAADFVYSSAFSSTGYAPVLTSAGLIEGIGFSGSFSGATTQLGTITFSALNAGVANLVTAQDSIASSRFYNGSSYNGMSFGSATANITAVPVPAAVWLLGSGLLGLVGLSRRA